MNPPERWRVPLVDLTAQHAPLKPALLSAVERVLDHGRFILGPEVDQLETRWAKMCGTRHAVAVSDGTTALTLVLKALGIGEGDEVITAPNSFLASASCIVHAGAKPRFADVGDDFNLDPAAVETVITERTRAIIAVHLTGRPADMDALTTLAERHGLFLVEDAAQAMGARYRGKPVGGLADAACFSLHPLKTAGACGDAGMITTDDDRLADRLRLLRNHGTRTRQEDACLWGFNARMDTLQAAMTLVKLDFVPAWIERRRRHAERYRGRIGRWVRIPDDRPGDTAVYHTFPVETDRRDELLAFLRERGIEAVVHYPVPLYRLPHAARFVTVPLPMADRQADRALSLPIHEGLTDEQIDFVCDAIEAFHRDQNTTASAKIDHSAQVTGSSGPISETTASAGPNPRLGTGKGDTG